MRGAAGVADGAADAVGARQVSVLFTLTYDIDNSGTDVLNITTPITIANTSGCNVTVTQQPGSPVAMAGATQLAMQVTPTAVGTFSFDIMLTNDDANENPYDIAVSGTSFGVPEIHVVRTGATSILDGGTDVAGSHQATLAFTRSYDINNIGTSTLTLTVPVSISGLTNCTVVVSTQPSATVAAGATTQLEVSITPSGAGAFDFDISVANDDANENPYNWTVSGTATAAPGGSGGGDGGGGSCIAAHAGGIAAFPFLLAVLGCRRRRAVSA